MADPALRITEIPQRAVVRLKWYSLSPSLAPSPRDGAGAAQDARRLLALAPGEWWIVSDALTGAELREDLRKSTEGYVACVDLSCGVKALRVEGRAARDLLAKGCGLDLHPRCFAPGSATRTRFAQLAVTLERIDSSCFELYVGRSHFEWLRAWLDDAALEFQQPTA